MNLYQIPSTKDTVEKSDDSSENALERILEARHSCRAFKSEMVDRRILERLLTMAQRTASWCNAQPWKAYVLSGTSLENVKKSLTEYVKEGAEKSPELKAPDSYTDERLARRRQSGFALYQALGIKREDREARARWHLENYKFFGAPHVVLITAAQELGEYGVLDTGAYMTTLMLAAESVGIASCPQAAPALYSPAIREALTIPDEERIVATVALGYEDTQSPANSIRIPRASLEETVSFLA